jgi:putative ABC transport system ATP-binding protein
MIELESIGKTYGEGDTATAVLEDVTFRIEAGEYVAVMGTSGTGKSTLMHILGCLDRPTDGRYRFDGLDVGVFEDRTLSRLRNDKIGFVFQQFHLLDRASALRNVMLPLIYARVYPADAEERATTALTAVGLEDRMSYRPGELSGGQQQRVAIARALVNDPQVILADEPTGNLDRRSTLEILAIFRRLRGEGRTIVLVTHDEEVARHAERILILESGRIASDTPVSSPRNAEEELSRLVEEETAARGEAPSSPEEGEVR